MAGDLIAAVVAHACDRPDAPAVVELDTGRVVARRAIVAEAVRLAGRLDETGPAGGTVMLHGPSGAAYWSGLLAVLGTGRRLLPLGPETSAADRMDLAISHRISSIVETRESAGVDPVPEGVVSIPVAIGEDAALDADRARSILDRGAGSSLLLRSSGTTGRPGVALRSAAALDRVAATLVETIGLHDDDRVLATLPMQHAYGIEHGVLAPMLAGATVVFKLGFDLTGGAAALLDGTTVFPAVPVTLEAATRVGRHGTSLRLAYTAGAPLPDSVRIAFESEWGVPVADLYGMTEVGTISWGFDHDRRAVSGVSVGVIDPEASDEDAVIHATGHGEIVVRSDAMSDGYLGAADAVPDPGRRIDGHLRTGDLGEIDEDGRLRITGRAKLQFDVGGLKVNPEEVEAVLGRNTGVHEVAVVPVPLTETVTRVMAVVVPEPDHAVDHAALEKTMREAAREHLAPHQRPRIVKLVDALPRSATGKLLRGRLVAEFSAVGG